MPMFAGMLVNHLAKRHPEVPPTAVPELNLPILKTTKDFYCQYCDKVETGAISSMMFFDQILRFLFRYTSRAARGRATS